MEFRILGPLEVADQGQPLALGSGRQLALVGLLLMHRNEVVSTERIVDELWGETPPPTAGKIVRNSVSLLRKELGERLVTGRGGYLLQVEPGELDADRLERAVEDGSLAQLTEGLALWRGTPLPELSYQPFAQGEIARLEELRLTAIEARIEAELEQGRGSALVPELERLVRGHPLRERLRGQLMLALYRSGRQAEALEAYQEARRTLTAELGLEPGRQLQELERQILNQDETLDAPARAAVEASRRRSGLLIALGAALLLAAGIAVAAIELTRGGGGHGLARLAADSVGLIDPKTNRIVAEVPVGATPTRLALAEGTLWVVNSEDDTVSRIDADRKVVVRTIPLPGPPSGVAADEKAAWVVYRRSQVASGGVGSAGLALVDARFNDVTRTVQLGRPFEYEDAVAVGMGSVWTADSGFVTRLDSRTGKTLARIAIGGTNPGVGVTVVDGLAVGNGAVWAIGSAGVVRIDPATNSIVATIPVAQGVAGSSPSPTALALGEGALWVTSRFVSFSSASLHPHVRPPQPGTLSRIDPATNAVVATIRVGIDSFGVATADGAVWVANRTGFSVSRIDPGKNHVVATISVGNRAMGIAAGNGAVWLSVAG